MKSPYSTNRAPSAYNSNTQRSYRTERRASSRYEQQSSTGETRYSGISPGPTIVSKTPIIKAQPIRNKSAGPVKRNKTPTRTLVIPSTFMNEGKGTKSQDQVGTKVMTSSLSLAQPRRIGSPKKVSASIPSFQISLPSPPELKEKASAVLKNLKQPPYSARLPSTRSRVTKYKIQQNNVFQFKTSTDLSGMLSSVEDSRANFTDNDDLFSAKMSTEFSTKSARVMRTTPIQPRQNPSRQAKKL